MTQKCFSSSTAYMSLQPGSAVQTPPPLQTGRGMAAGTDLTWHYALDHPCRPPLHHQTHELRLIVQRRVRSVGDQPCSCPGPSTTSRPQICSRESRPRLRPGGGVVRAAPRRPAVIPAQRRRGGVGTHRPLVHVYTAVRPEHDDTHMGADFGSAGLVVGQQVACPADAGVQVGQEGVQRRPLRLDGGTEVEL